MKLIFIFLLIIVILVFTNLFELCKFKTEDNLKKEINENDIFIIKYIISLNFTKEQKF